MPPGTTVTNTLTASSMKMKLASVFFWERFGSAIAQFLGVVVKHGRASVQNAVRFLGGNVLGPPLQLVARQSLIPLDPTARLPVFELSYG